VKNPTGTKTGKSGFFVGCGINHVRYDHKSRPTRIDIKCPRCNGLAMAKDIDNTKYEFVSDLAPTWDNSSFSVTCANCLYRKEKLSYGELAEPYYQIYGRGEVLWAWNRLHLDMLLKYLNGRDVKGHPYEFYQTYVHGDWKKYRESYIKGISKFLDDDT
jgi:hypothetical protein